MGPSWIIIAATCIGLLVGLCAVIPLASGQQHVFKAGELGYHIIAIPAILRTSNSTLLAFAEARVNGGDYDHIDLAMKRSLDNGWTWGAIQILAGARSGTSKTDHGQPTPILDKQAGKVVLVWCMNNSFVFVQTSSDDGLTWTLARNITDMVKRPGWGWMATGPNHGTQLSSGRLVAPFNTFFESSTVTTRTEQTGCMNTHECAVYRSAEEQSLRTTVEITNPKDPEMPPLHRVINGTVAIPPYVRAGDRSGVLYSDDHGDTWKIGGMIDSRIGSSECVAEGTHEGLLLSFRVEDPDTRCRKMALSRDGGQTFEPFFEPSACIPDPTCQGSMLRLSNDRLVTSGPGSKSARENITLFISEKPHAADGAEPLRFRKLAQVAKGPGHYSDIVEIPPTAGSASPSVGVVYDDRGSGIIWVAVPTDAESDLNIKTFGEVHLV